MAAWGSEQRATFLYWLQSNPCMYASGTSAYRDKNARRQAINEICSVMDIDTNTVMTKIKSLRTYISNRKMKKLRGGILTLEDGGEGEMGEGEGEGEEMRIKQEVTDEFGDLQFLAPYVLPKASSLVGCDVSTLTEAELGEDPFPRVNHVMKKKRTVSNDQQHCQQSQSDGDEPQTVPQGGALPPGPHAMLDLDPDYHFFMSLYGDFRKIHNSQLRGRLKLDLQRIIYEAQFQGILPGQIEF